MSQQLGGYTSDSSNDVGIEHKYDDTGDVNKMEEVVAITIDENLIDTGIVDEKNTVVNAANINDSIDQNIVDTIADEKNTVANAANINDSIDQNIADTGIVDEKNTTTKYLLIIMIQSVRI